MQKAAVFLSLLLGLSFFSKAQTSTPSADDVLKEACTKAAQENKKVLLIFHASWCVWCRKMDSSLHDKTVWPLIHKSYELAHLTVYESASKKSLENPGALEFLKKYGRATDGIPYWFVLDKDGKVLANSEYESGRNSGCPATVKEVAYFVDVLKKTSALNEDELKLIAKRFRRNEE